VFRVFALSACNLIEYSLRFRFVCCIKNIKILFLLVTRRILRRSENPWSTFQQLASLSIRQMEVTRFYLQLKRDPHGRNVALFVGNLPKQDSERRYEKFLKNILKGWSNEKCTYLQNYKNMYLHI